MGFETKTKKGIEFIKYVALEQENKSIVLQSGKPQSIELLQYIFKLLPDYQALLIDQALDVQALIRLFTEVQKLRLDTLEFRRFMWFEERAEIVAKFIKSSAIRKLSIITVNDCNKGLGSLFQILPSIDLTHLKIASNVLCAETVSKLVASIPKLQQLRVLDLSCIAYNQVSASKSKENFTIKILEQLESYSDMLFLETLVLKGCDVGLVGAQTLKHIISGPIKELDISTNQLFSKGIQELFGSVSKTKIVGTNLVKLNLSNNNIDEQGVSAVCGLLANSQ